jgi:hypothetical protein
MTASNTLLASADDFTPARFSAVMISAISARPPMHGICGGSLHANAVEIQTLSINGCSS